MDLSVYQKRKRKNWLGLGFSLITMLIGLFALFWILYVLFAKGFSAFDLNFFTKNTPGAGTPGGGLLNAIVGSTLIVFTSTFFSTPIGILAGIYLSEYGNENKIAGATRFVVDIMLSAPSIVVGLFIYAIYVNQVKHFSGLAGAMALSLIAIPVVVKTTDNILRLIPNTLRESAYALGAPKWKVSTTVILKAGRSGVITGILLSIARVSGETAPLIFTALNSQFFSLDMNNPISNLPVVIYQFAMSAYDNWIHLAWGGALLITLIVLTLNVLSRTFFGEKYDL